MYTGASGPRGTEGHVCGNPWWATLSPEGRTFTGQDLGSFFLLRNLFVYLTERELKQGKGRREKQILC